jgi:hypothetical protein
MAAVELNVARLDGPFGEHSLGNLMNTRRKAEGRLARPNLAATHNANRSTIAAINRHMTLRRARSQAVEANAAARRRAAHAARMAEEAANPMPVGNTRTAGPMPGSTIGPFLSSQARVTGVPPAGVRPLGAFNMRSRRGRKHRRATRRLRR